MAKGFIFLLTISNKMHTIKHTHPILLLGGHMSTSGGFANAISRGESIGCTAIQIFVKSNRQWYAKPITDQEATAFKDAWQQSQIKNVIAHAAYLINIGSPNKDAHAKSLEALSVELDRCEQLGIPSLVLHPGSRLDTAPEQCYKTIAQGLDEVISNYAGKTQILLENMAGQGSNVGNSFEALAEIYHHVHHKRRVGFCLDTCHAFVAGYDLSSAEGYTKTWNEFDAILGIENLKAIHINDSKKGLGSKADRHEHIGHGKIGSLGFKLLFNDPRFFDIPKVLETPKEGDGLKEDAQNMQTIVGLLDAPNKKLVQGTPLERYIELP